MKYRKLLLLVLISTLIFSQTHVISSSQIKSIVQVKQSSISNNNLTKTQQPPDILRIGIRNDANESIEFFPPIGLMYLINSLIFEPLVELDIEKNEIVPVLAYQWVVSNDSKHWTFYLRNDVLFHDGSVFNASAVKFSFEKYENVSTATNPFEKNENVSPGSILESIEIVNEFQVILHYSVPFSPFINREAQFISIFSPNSFEGDNLTNPIGTSPYKIDLEHSNSTFLNFTRFNSYYGGIAPFKEIHLIIYPHVGFEHDISWTNKLDIALDVPSHWYIDHTYWDYLKIDPRNNLETASFSHKRPEFKKKEVRLAINYAIDKVMLTNEDPYDYPSRSILPQGYLGHDESIKGYPYDFEKAEKLLDDAGYTRDDSNSRFNLTISAFLIDEYQITQGTLGHIISSLSKLGINCELIIEDKEILQEKLENGEIDIFLLDTIHDTDSAFLYVYLHSEGIYNYCGFRNDIVDLLLELSIATPVIQEREYYYQQIQKICQEKVPYLLLVESGITYTRAKHVAPYVYFNGAYRFRFNCTKIFHNSKVILPNVEITKSNNNNLKTMTDIKVKENALYFPFTDAIVTNFNEQPITVTMRMSNELTRFLPDHEEKGKFYEVLTDEPNLPYRVRCYYDLPELDKDRSIDQLAIFEYDDRDETWIELTTKTSNSSLKYLEVELIGSYSLLRLGELAAEITYKFLPFVAIITVFMSGIISITIFYNQKIAKYVQKMEETL